MVVLTTQSRPADECLTNLDRAREHIAARDHHRTTVLMHPRPVENQSWNSTNVPG